MIILQLWEEHARAALMLLSLLPPCLETLRDSRAAQCLHHSFRFPPATCSANRSMPTLDFPLPPLLPCALLVFAAAALHHPSFMDLDQTQWIFFPPSSTAALS